MDISSLLSPKDSPASETPPAASPHSSPLKRPGRLAQRHSSGLVQQYSPSPSTPASQSNALPSIAAHNSAYQASSTGHYAQQGALPSQIELQPQSALSPGIAIQPQGLASPGIATLQAQQSLPSPGHLSPALIATARSLSANNSVHTPASEPRYAFGATSDARLTPSRPSSHRQGSSASMDALADLASLQQTPPHGDGQRNTSISFSDIHALQRSISARSGSEVTMTDAPPLPRVFKSRSLSEEDLRRLSELDTQLTAKPDDYTAHVGLLDLLHKGFVDHINAPDAPIPHDYELLKELRDARARMEDKYPVGEDLWIDWINDERILADSTEARLSLMELCSRSVEDEPSSARLWKNYGDFMYHLWESAFHVDPDSPSDWSEEDKQIGREVFTWKAMLEIWQRGTAATQWHLNDSNLVWDRYMEILGEDQSRQPSADKVGHLRSLFESRLRQPHATWDRTFEAFSGFTSTYDNANYEEVMVQIKERCTSAKRQFALREAFEFEIQKAAERGDKDAEWAGYSAYLDWELKRKGAFSFPLQNALYERATLRFSTDSSIWEDYVGLLIQYSDDAVPVLPVLIRATRHCPWSGSLWAHYILTLEAEGKDFDVLEDVKHRATRTGILDSAGMEELLIIYIAWCGALRRRAFGGASTEDDIDIAEVGIRSALEHVKEIGEQRYGKEYAGDPQYRLERIHIKFLLQSGNIDSARELWRSLTKTHSHSYDFWYRYYIFEMVLWGKFAGASNQQQQHPTPHGPTHVLREALNYVGTLDWPETLIQMFLNHVEQHESIQELRTSMTQARKATKEVTRRREKEREAAAAAYLQQQEAQQQAEASESLTEDGGNAIKRKREDYGEENAAKRPKAGEEDVVPTLEVDPPDPKQSQEANSSSSLAAQAKRDRENTTVMVKNLPLSANETEVRKFFRNCGVVLSITLSSEEGDEKQTAAVEFESAEDAQFAQSRDGKDFSGNEVSVSIGTGTVLWVTNYPPTADEQYIHDLFKDYGDVIEVRFPSLQFNTHRRFCYVQFATAAQAQAATKMNGHKLEDKYDLVAKISNPSLKHDKMGPAHEGRELYIGHLSWNANEKSVKELCSSYGKVEKVRIPKNAAGRSKGSAFVVFSSKDEVAAAAAALNNTTFMGRDIIASISNPKAGGPKRTAHAIYTSASPDPAHAPHSRASSVGSRPNGATAGSPIPPGPTDNSAAASARARTLALLDVPDTVNDQRIFELMKSFGAIRKVVLRPDHQGALVEFVDIQSLGIAELAFGVEGLEISEGRRVRLGTYEDLRASGREYKSNKLTTGGARKRDAGSGAGAEGGKKDGGADSKPKAFGSGFISRPAQRGGGRRGGLGLKNAGVGFSGPRARNAENAASGSTAAEKDNAEKVKEKEPNDVEMNMDVDGPSAVNGAEAKLPPAKKSNADFRALFVKSKMQGENGETAAEAS